MAFEVILLYFGLPKFDGQTFGLTKVVKAQKCNFVIVSAWTEKWVSAVWKILPAAINMVYWF